MFIGTERNIDLFTYATFCSDYHSGQASRGYRILCTLLRKISKRNRMMIYAQSQDFCRQRTLYSDLVRRYEKAV